MPTQAPVRLLALDTSTHRMSVGVGLSVAEPGQTRLWLQEAEGGAQASATLIPAILNLLTQAKTPLTELDALVWGHGPGAFTGLRTAAAVVQGLAYGTRPPHHPNGLPVLGIDTLLAVAEEARAQWATRTTPACPGQPLTITAVLDARMDEVYAATYTFGQADQPTATLQAGPWLLKPDELAANLGNAARQGLLAGNAFDLLGHRLPDTTLGRQPAWPTAGALLRLAPGLLAAGQAAPAAQAQPLYVRDKVAQTTEERLPRPAQPGPAPAAAA